MALRGQAWFFTSGILALCGVNSDQWAWILRSLFDPELDQMDLLPWLALYWSWREASALNARRE